ncbi:conserved hypothetical protein (plasmid) [Paraburkholderia phytofirmans PsJN]|uniref:Uncharacterized protein n=2 Tax=Paraburkholderia phytofirmans TaxID=261302 RepID=B2TH91_PARPJ|nr:conserved hypothetical protein [Paraburkholderia phytofirmans PsJN]
MTIHAASQGATAHAHMLATPQRAHALSVGTLIDVSATARRAMFRVPVALTSGAWLACVDQGSADLPAEERLWSVLFAAFGAIRRKSRPTDRAGFAVDVRRDGRDIPILLTAIVSSGDDGEPVITIHLTAEL